MKELRGKTALITGASRGIGPHIVEALAEEGMNVVLSGRDAKALDATAESAGRHGVKAICIPADIRNRAELASLAERAEAESGGVHVLVNNAGIERALPFDQVDIDSIDEMMEVNLVAPMVLARMLLPNMIRRREGHIVNMSSVAGLVGTPYEETYAATKHGLVGFSRSLALTLRSEGHPIGVTAICPAFVADAGMYHNASVASGAGAPMMIGTVPMRQVARAVVKAIRANKIEILLTGKPMLPFLLTQTISPKAAAWMSKAVGVPQMFKKWAATSTT